MATHLKLRLGLTLATIAMVGGISSAQAQVPGFSSLGGPIGSSPLSDSLTSKLYAVEVEGEAYIEHNGEITPLSAREIYIAEGAAIYTYEDSAVSMVASNGTGLFLDANSRFTVVRAAQEPFTGERSDMINEPSVSNIQLKHEYGTLGICTSRLLVGTLLEVFTEEAIVRIPDGKIVFERAEEGEEPEELGTKITLVGGDANVQPGTIYYEGQGRELRVRHQIFFPIDGAEPTVTELRGHELNRMEGLVAIACLARRSVYFDALPDDVITNPDQIEAIPTTPGFPGPGGGGPGSGSSLPPGDPSKGPPGGAGGTENPGTVVSPSTTP